MKAFVWAVLACIVISAAAGIILTSQEDAMQSARVADGVRVR
ncbi:MAG: hypothetical protein ACTSQV_05900 [Alphaproteobacteria bacterium]